MPVTAIAQREKQQFELAIQSLQGTLVNSGVHLTIDSSARLAYDKQVKAMAAELRSLAQSNKISWAEASKRANEARNTVMDNFRWRSTPVGRAMAQQLKTQGKTLNELVAKKTISMFGGNADFNRLTALQKNQVFAEIVKSAGKTNAGVNSTMQKLGTAGRGLIVLSVAISIYNIATADDKVAAVKKEGTVAAGGFLGGVAGGATAGLLCGPGAPVCVTVGAFVGGVLVVFGVNLFW